MGIDWEVYCLELLSVFLGLGIASPIIISAYVIIKNDGITTVKKDLFPK
jgi:hypothetical protein